MAMKLYSQDRPEPDLSDMDAIVATGGLHPDCPAPAPPYAGELVTPRFRQSPRRYPQSLAAEKPITTGTWPTRSSTPKPIRAQLRGGDPHQQPVRQGASPVERDLGLGNCHAGCKSTPAAGSRPRLRPSSEVSPAQIRTPVRAPPISNPPTAIASVASSRPRRSGEPALELQTPDGSLQLCGEGRGPSRRWSTLAARPMRIDVPTTLSMPSPPAISSPAPLLTLPSGWRPPVYRRRPRRGQRLPAGGGLNGS